MPTPKRHARRRDDSILRYVRPLCLLVPTDATRRRKPLSLVDCTSFAFMRHGRISTAFAYDRHFEELERLAAPSGSALGEVEARLHDVVVDQHVGSIVADVVEAHRCGDGHHGLGWIWP